MTDRKLKSWLRLSHRWVGILAAFILVISGLSGFLLFHPTWLGSKVNTAVSLSADPLTPGRLLRGTHWGVEITTDGGRTWDEIPMLAPPTDVRRIAFAPDDPKTILALGADLLVASYDGGMTWADIPLWLSGIEPGTVFLDLTVGPGDNWYLLTNEGMLTSTDRGNHWQWTARNAVSPGTDWYRLVHDIHTGYLAGETGRRLVEAGALALMFITGTGIVLYLRNGRILRK
jgi:photosystem II stability/assembly factor-like uncharacterized protein